MNHRDRSWGRTGIAVLLTIVAVAVCAVRLWGSGPSDTRLPADYAYVGVEQTIARVDRSTGRMWILRHQDSTRASLLSMPDQRGWRWDEIAVRPDRSPVHIERTDGAEVDPR